MIFLDSAGAEDKRLEVEFNNSIQQVVNESEAQISRGTTDADALFYAGFALGYLAKFDAAKGDKLKAAREGDKGLSYHKKLLEMYPKWYDVNLSEALFNYYTCVLPWYMKPILFILGRSGTRDRAYELLTLVAAKGWVSKYEAENMIGELYAREQNFDSLSVTYSKLTSQFPRATFYYCDRMLWAFTDGSQYRLVVDKSKETIKLSEERKLSHWDSLYIGKIQLRLADAYEHLGEFGDAMAAYNEFIIHDGTICGASKAHFYLANLYEKTNDPSNAIREYEWVVNKSVDMKMQKEATERLDDLEVR